MLEEGWRQRKQRRRRRQPYCPCRHVSVSPCLWCTRFSSRSTASIVGGVHAPTYAPCGEYVEYRWDGRRERHYAVYFRRQIGKASRRDVYKPRLTVKIGIRRCRPRAHITMNIRWYDERMSSW